MIKNNYVGKTKEEAINNAKIALQETENNLYIKEVETKSGLFSKKVEIEVIRRDDVIDYAKNLLKELIEKMGLSVNIEVKKREENVTFTCFSDNNSILIGKMGRTLDSLSIVIRNAVQNELGAFFNLNIDIAEYKVQQNSKLESLAKRTAREVFNSKIPVKLDPMNSYERRIIHNILNDYKNIITSSEGEEPNRCVVISPRESE